MSRDYLLYNFTGFLFYALFTASKYYSQRRFPPAHSVEGNDLAFAINAFIMTSCTIWQVQYYDEDLLSTRKLSKAHLTFLSILWLALLVHHLVFFLGYLPFADTSYAGYGYSLVEFLGYSKGMNTGTKYIPQAYMNYKYQSTVGCSIVNVLLDLLGVDYGDSTARHRRT